MVSKSPLLPEKKNCFYRQSKISNVFPSLNEYWFVLIFHLPITNFTIVRLSLDIIIDDFQVRSKMKKIILFTGSIILTIMAHAQSPTFQWAKQIGGPLNDYSQSIIVDALGNVYTTGYFSNTVDFDPSTATYTLSSSAGSTDIFISKLDNAGNFVWAKKIGGSGYDVAISIATDRLGNIYITG